MQKQLLDLYLKYKIIIFPVMIGLACLALVWWVIYPQTKQFFKVQGDIQAAEKKLQKLISKVKDLEAIDQNDLDNKLKYALVALPIDRDLPTIVGLFQSLAANNTMTLTALQLGQGQSQGTLTGTQGFTVKIETVGSKASLSKFLDDVEKSPRVMKTSIIDISSSKEDFVTAGVSVDISFAQTPTALGEIDADLPKLTPDDEKLMSSLAATATSIPNVTEDNLLPRGKPNPFQ